MPETNGDLESRYNELKRRGDREAAEVAFALTARATSPAERARWRDELEGQVRGRNTLEECATHNVSIGGVLIPGFLHADTAKRLD